MAAALAFHNCGFKDIHVYESRPESAVRYQSPEESYPIGVNMRGLTSLRELISGNKESGDTLDVSKLGSLVSSWQIFVTKREWQVAKFDSGAVYGTTRSTVVQILIEEIKKREPDITVHYEHSCEDVDAASKTVTLQQKEVRDEGEMGAVKVQCDYLVVADGHRSRSRDSLAKQSKLVVQQWPWNMTFRVLLSDNSDNENSKKLEADVHYIVNRIYLATIPDGRWVAVTSCKSGSVKDQFLLSKDPSDENVRRLKEHVKNNAPMAQHLFSDDEYKAFFNRVTFTGAVTKVSEVFVNNWALIIGDAAHSAIPASGEGVNSSLEDARVLQQALMEHAAEVTDKSNNTKKNHIEKAFQTYQKKRLADIHALSEIAYNYANPSSKGQMQSIMLPLFGCLVSQSKILKTQSKETLLFGPSTIDNVMRYSDILKEWEKQVKLLGGRPQIPE